MEAKLQRRVQRYGWDLAAGDYELLWRSQLAVAHARLLEHAALARGEHVLDVACGTGVVSMAAARAVGAAGTVTGVDLSGRMVEVAWSSARARGIANAHFERMDAERLLYPDGSFDVVTCALGLMYVPDAGAALAEMRRVLRPGGRLVLAVWGERAQCGWAGVFPIVDAEVESDVCPLFFRLGEGDALARSCESAGLRVVDRHRISTPLEYDGANAACSAAFVGGPMALAWSRFDDAARERACARYLESIDRWRHPGGYRIPGQFLIVTASRDA